MAAHDRPRRLYVAMGLLALVAAVLGVAAAAIAVAGFAAGIVIGPLLLFLATVLGVLAALAATGVAGMWHGSPRGFWTSVAAHALVLLALGAFMVDISARPPGLNKYLPAATVAAVVLASGALLLTEDSRDWHGI